MISCDAISSSPLVDGATTKACMCIVHIVHTLGEKFKRNNFKLSGSHSGRSSRSGTEQWDGREEEEGGEGGGDRHQPRLRHHHLKQQLAGEGANRNCCQDFKSSTEEEHIELGRGNSVHNY